MKYYLTLKKREIRPFMITWVKLEAIILSEINHTEKEKHCMASLTCGFLKKFKLIETE